MVIMLEMDDGDLEDASVPNNLLIGLDELPINSAGSDALELGMPTCYIAERQWLLHSCCERERLQEGV